MKLKIWNKKSKVVRCKSNCFNNCKYIKCIELNWCVIKEVSCPVVKVGVLTEQCWYPLLERKHNWIFKHLQDKIAYLINVPVIKLLPCTLNSTSYVLYHVAGAGNHSSYYLVPCGFLLIGQLEGHWKIGRGKKPALPVYLLYLSAISLHLFINSIF